MKRSALLVLLITTLNLNMLAQSTHDLVLPKKSDGVIQWNVSTFPKGGGANLGYEELAVFVTNATGENSPIPVQGRFSHNAEYLIFTPYFPFEKGLTYKVRTKLPDTIKYDIQNKNSLPFS